VDGAIGSTAQIGSTAKRLAMIVNKPDHHFARRSSFAWAKYADAFFRISLARRSSKFSRSSCFRHWRSSVVSPALPRVALGLPHPAPQRLALTADLAGDRLDHGPDPLSEWALRRSWYGSTGRRGDRRPHRTGSLRVGSVARHAEVEIQ
jgi:hypothetical protein